MHSPNHFRTPESCNIIIRCVSKGLLNFQVCTKVIICSNKTQDTKGLNINTYGQIYVTFFSITSLTQLIIASRCPWGTKTGAPASFKTSAYASKQAITTERSSSVRISSDNLGINTWIHFLKPVKRKKKIK